MSKYRYRYERGTSEELESDYYRAKPLDKIQKIGNIQKIEAIRYRGQRTTIVEGEKHPLILEFERLRITGDKGSVRLSGVCWGYNGQGPRACYAALTRCNVPANIAKHFAFKVQRKQELGTDWTIRFNS